MSNEGKKGTKVISFPYLMMLPAIFVLAIVVITPIVKAFIMSLGHNVLIDPASYQPYVGLQNYVRMVKDPAFWNSLWISAYYTAGSVIGAYLIGLLFAVLLNRKVWGRSVFRSVSILPWAMPYVATVLIWLWLYEPQTTGVINWMLLRLGIVMEPAGFLVNMDMVMPSLIVVNAWKEFPFAMIMLLAGLQMIPKDLYEAAAVDGASPWMRFWKITMPGLSYINKLVVLLLGIMSFKQFTIIHLMTGGGPGGASDALIIKTYNAAFSEFNMSYSAALGIASLFISFLFGIVHLMTTRRKEGDG